jgi:hypothetical protein
MGTLDVADVEDQIEAEQGTDDIVSVWFRTVVGSVRAVTRVFAPAHRNRR